MVRFAVEGKAARSVKLLVADRNNSLAIYACEMQRGGAVTPVATVALQGHRSEPRCIALSTDDRMVRVAEP